MTSPPRRLAGLDTLRALAIVLVFASHYMGFVTGEATFGFVSEIGWAGVDLFFALSGYLIGNQILAGLRGGSFSLSRFYARRLLRTLPNYYVVLALYAFWPAFGGTSPHAPWWRYITFTLNLGLMPGTRFSHAWSLCVEEQFYLLLPAVALLIAAATRSLRLAWVAIAGCFLAGIVLRMHGWQEAQPLDDIRLFYREIYYSSLCRFDELVAGVALALLRNYHRSLWDRVTGWGNWTLAAGIIVVAATFRPFLDNQYGHAITLVGYPLLGLGFSLLIVSALSPASLLARVRVPGAASLALWSYAIYLTHKQLCIMLGAWLASHTVNAGAPAGAALLSAASIFTGWLLYTVVEMPFMGLRDRWFPTSRTAAPPAVAVPAS